MPVSRRQSSSGRDPLERGSFEHRPPVLSSVEECPETALKTAAAIALLEVGCTVALALPFLSAGGALAISSPLGGMVLGIGLGYDLSLSEAESRRLFAVGSALLIFGFIGLAIGSRESILAVAPLAFALKTISIGDRLART